MNTADDIPVEIRARVEANVLFDAVRAGDFARAAQAQESLRRLGWHVSREPIERASGQSGRKRGARAQVVAPC
jgi:hypothetical protein